MIPELTCIMIKHSGHIFLGKRVVGVAHQEASFADGTVADHYTFQHDRTGPVGHDTQHIIIIIIISSS